MVVIDSYRRYQAGLIMRDVLAEQVPGFCACGCGLQLTGRRTRWATTECSAKAYRDFLIIKGDTRAIRQALFERDEGRCKGCDYTGEWDADHIVPVHQGGGGRGLKNFQTLCLECHKAKTIRQAKEARLTPENSNTLGVV